MIKRYTRQIMDKIWQLDSKFDYYLKVELAVCKAYKECEKISCRDYEFIENNAKFDVSRIDEIEKEVKHDVIAFLTNVNESLGEKGRLVHMGLTSSDIIDTAFALQIKDASDIILNDLKILIKSLKSLAKKHSNTITIGRSHGIHAEIMTFGTKILNWVDMFERALSRFEEALREILTGQISGPVGTYSNIDPKIERLALSYLGLTPARISTQIISRDRHALFMQNLALIASLIELCSTEIRHLQKTEVLEVEEGFSINQKGSSAMPHKKNPIACENLSGLARVVRSNSIAALENIPLWHERDISHSSVERIIFPDTTILIDYMLNRFNNVINNLIIHPDNMEKNASLFGGIVFSQNVLLKLTDKGLTREDAYKLVQTAALEAFNNHGNFKKNLLNSPEITKILSPNEIEDAFNREKYLKNIPEIFSRFTL